MPFNGGKKDKKGSKEGERKTCGSSLKRKNKDIPIFAFKQELMKNM